MNTIRRCLKPRLMLLKRSNANVENKNDDCDVDEPKKLWLLGEVAAAARARESGVEGKMRTGGMVREQKGRTEIGNRGMMIGDADGQGAQTETQRNHPGPPSDPMTTMKRAILHRNADDDEVILLIDDARGAQDKTKIPTLDGEKGGETTLVLVLVLPAIQQMTASLRSDGDLARQNML